MKNIYLFIPEVVRKLYQCINVFLLYFENIVNLYNAETKEVINKSDFYKKLVSEVNLSFIKTQELPKKDFSNDTLSFLKKVSDYEKFIEAFVNLTKGKTYTK